MKRIFFLLAFLWSAAHAQTLNTDNPRLWFYDLAESVGCVSYNYCGCPNPYLGYWTFTGGSQNTCAQNSTVTVSTSTAYKRSGTSSYKIQVNYTGNNNGPNARGEWGLFDNEGQQFDINNEYHWVGFSFAVDPAHTFDSSRVSIGMNMKEADDAQQTPFYVALKGKRFAIYGRFVNGETPVMFNTCVPGVFYDLVYYSNRKADATGIQRFYINNVMVWEKFGPTRDPNNSPINRIQNGWYKWTFYQNEGQPIGQGPLIGYWDDIKVGKPTATLADMAAGDPEGGPVDQFPVADAGPNTGITLPTTSKAMVASASDADGTIASYAWTTVSKPSGSPTPTFTPSASVEDPTVGNLTTAGVYTFRLTVTDNDGHTGFDDVVVTVTAAGPPVTNPVFTVGGCTGISGPGACTYYPIADRNLTLPTSAIDSLALYAAPTDTVSWVTAIELTQIGTSPAVATISSPYGYAYNYMPEFVYHNISGMTVAGTYTFRATAETNLGGFTADTFNIVVGAEDNTPPEVFAGADVYLGVDDYGELLTVNTTVTGTATDDDGTIASHQWVKLSAVPSNASIATPDELTTKITGLGPGQHLFRLNATDNDGATSFDDLSIYVLSANAGQDTTLNSPYNYMNLIGYGSSGKAIDSVRWRFDQGSNGASITNPTSLTGASITGLPNGGTSIVLTIYYADGIIANSKRLILYNGASGNRNFRYKVN